jgi:hypothetical protein
MMVNDVKLYQATKRERHSRQNFLLFGKKLFFRHLINTRI